MTGVPRRLGRAAARVKQPLDAVRALRALLDAGGRGALHGRRRRRARGVEALARELGVEDRCRLVGFQRGSPDWYAGFDAFCLTSVNEGTPVAAIEALAAAAAGRRDAGRRRARWSRNGEDGFLVPSATTRRWPRGSRAGRDPDAAERMGARGAERMCGSVLGRPDGRRVEALYRRLFA